MSLTINVSNPTDPSAPSTKDPYFILGGTATSNLEMYHEYKGDTTVIPKDGITLKAKGACGVGNYIAYSSGILITFTTTTAVADGQSATEFSISVTGVITSPPASNKITFSNAYFQAA